MTRKSSKLPIGSIDGPVDELWADTALVNWPLGFELNVLLFVFSVWLVLTVRLVVGLVMTEKAALPRKAVAYDAIDCVREPDRDLLTGGFKLLEELLELLC